MTPAEIRKRAERAVLLYAAQRGMKGHKKRSFARAVALATVLKAKP